MRFGSLLGALRPSSIMKNVDINHEPGGIKFFAALPNSLSISPPVFYFQFLDLSENFLLFRLCILLERIYKFLSLLFFALEQLAQGNYFRKQPSGSCCKILAGGADGGVVVMQNNSFDVIEWAGLFILS